MPACPCPSQFTEVSVICVVILLMAVSLPVHKLHEGRDWDCSGVALSPPWRGPGTWRFLLFYLWSSPLCWGGRVAFKGTQRTYDDSNRHVCTHTHIHTHTHRYIHKNLEVSLWGLKFRFLYNWLEPSSAYTGRTDVEAPILWPPDLKSRLIRKDWCWERLKARKEGDERGWDGWIASPTQWTWVWGDSRKWWRTGNPGVLQILGLQRVRCNLVTE